MSFHIVFSLKEICTDQAVEAQFSVQILGIRVASAVDTEFPYLTEGISTGVWCVPGFGAGFEIALRSSSPATGVIWGLRAQSRKNSPKMGSWGREVPGVEKVEKESKKSPNLTSF